MLAKNEIKDELYWRQIAVEQTSRASREKQAVHGQAYVIFFLRESFSALEFLNDLSFTDRHNFQGHRCVEQRKNFLGTSGGSERVIA